MTTPLRDGGRRNAAFYPVGLRLEGLRVVVAGGGRVGARKVRRLVDYGADVLVVSPEAVEPIGELARAGRIRWERRRAEPRDLEGAVLVFAATDDPAANAALAAEARARGIPVNRADDPLDCGFIVPAVVECGGGRVAADAVDSVDAVDGMAGADGADRVGGMAGADRAGGAGGDAATDRGSDAGDGVGVVSVAVFTGGVAPSLAKWAAGRIRAELGAEFGAVGGLLAQVRPEVLALAVTQPRRAQIMEAVMASGAPEMAASGDAAGALARARRWWRPWRRGRGGVAGGGKWANCLCGLATPSRSMDTRPRGFAAQPVRSSTFRACGMNRKSSGKPTADRTPNPPRRSWLKPPSFRFMLLPAERRGRELRSSPFVLLPAERARDVAGGAGSAATGTPGTRQPTNPPQRGGGHRQRTASQSKTYFGSYSTRCRSSNASNSAR